MRFARPEVGVTAKFSGARSAPGLLCTPLSKFLDPPLNITISGAEAVVATESVPDQIGISTLPFFLDDLGCIGTESNLLDCLPQHNCRAMDPENAGVHCLRKGIITVTIVSPSSQRSP